MINKKNVLGKEPFDLGDKDAIHVAIVAVRAAKLIEPGQPCKLNDQKEAVACDQKDAVGVADPFLKKNILRGDRFWMLLSQDQVPNVHHVWDHPTVDFTPPTREVQKNRTLEAEAKSLGVTYEQLIEACNKVMENGETWRGYKAVPYPGTLTEEEFEDVQDNIDRWSLWSEWAEETGFEFTNNGSECCPEYEYPTELFIWIDKDE